MRPVPDSGHVTAPTSDQKPSTEHLSATEQQAIRDEIVEQAAVVVTQLATASSGLFSLQEKLVRQATDQLGTDAAAGLGGSRASAYRCNQRTLELSDRMREWATHREPRC